MPTPRKALQGAIRKALEVNYDPKIVHREREEVKRQIEEESASEDQYSGSEGEGNDSDSEESDSDEETSLEEEPKLAPPNGPPYSFYDRHIASSLLLKQVVYSPSIILSLSKNVDPAMKEILNTRMIRAESAFPCSLGVNMGSFYNAYDVAKYYIDNVGGFCALLASTFFFLPTRDTWEELLLWSCSLEPGFSNEVGLRVAQNENGGLYIPELEEHFSESVKKTIAELHAHSPRLAIWDFFPMSEPCLSMLQSMTRGSKAKNLARYRISLKHYLQKAWAKSVIDDTSFFILNCGRYERIGFRHRGTQTLYLSGVIDTINIQNPRYRKLHLGLLIEIVKDALRRLELTKSSVNDEEIKLVQGQKRPLDSTGVEEREVKRRRYEVEPSNRYLNEGKKELANRNLLLVELDYDVYCSPAPSTFLRIEPACEVPSAAAAKGHSKSRSSPRFPVGSRCETHEYALLTLEKPLGSGAVGVAHPAFLSLKLKSGDTLEASLVLKLAFTEDQKKGLRHEYCIYSRLAARSVVNGILSVYGLFRDPESGTLGLLMEYGGESLYARSERLRTDNTSEILTPAQKTLFREYLHNMHGAGILHGDIRPNNMLLHPNGSVFIIDFDRGDDLLEPFDDPRLDDPRVDFGTETRTLNNILTDRYRSP
ncbi:hypothetical protein CPC08DRAFT_712637 [Agrocybe pediades]|nr:hypothetical protein CPC08DRAFT_712637 [Agrocybe pediades]